MGLFVHKQAEAPREGRIVRPTVREPRLPFDIVHGLFARSIALYVYMSAWRPKSSQFVRGKRLLSALRGRMRLLRGRRRGAAGRAKDAIPRMTTAIMLRTWHFTRIEHSRIDEDGGNAARGGAAADIEVTTHTPDGSRGCYARSGALLEEISSNPEYAFTKMSCKAKKWKLHGVLRANSGSGVRILQTAAFWKIDALW